MGLVRVVLPCVPPKVFFSNYIICINTVSSLKCRYSTLKVLMIYRQRSTGVGSTGPEVDATQDTLLNSLATPIPIPREASV